jgi:Domain of unknown function (DUF4915)
MGDFRVVASSGHNRPDRSGLYLVDGGSVRLIDAFPCGGLTATSDRFYRVAPLRQSDGAEILVYDAHGVCRYYRIDDVGDPHDVLALDDARLLCVSTMDNAIVCIAGDGTLTTYWRADAPLDAWHLNCLALRDGRLFATAFGRFDTFRGWSARETTGMLFDVETGEVAVGELNQPHTPRWIDGGWVVCNSGANEVLRVEPDGKRYGVGVGGFCRGICAAGDHVYAGVSAPRGSTAETTGWLSVLDRERWTEVERIPLPCAGIYDLIEVSDAILRGLEAGFRSGSERERYFGQLAMFEQVGVTPKHVWAVAEALPPELCRARITADLPAAIAIGDVARVTCTIENTGGGFLMSAAPHPVEVCYRWFDAAGDEAGAGTWLHNRLPRVLAPRDVITFKVLVAPPPGTGRYTLRVTLLQEGVRWFDDVDPASAVSGDVRIYERRRAKGA